MPHLLQATLDVYCALLASQRNIREVTDRHSLNTHFMWAPNTVSHLNMARTLYSAIQVLL